MKGLLRTVLAVAVLLLAAGCATQARTPGSAMMGDGTGSRDSVVTCAASSLPGSVVQVVVRDMAMSHLATGTAPLGARMTLRATPVDVPAGLVSLVVTNLGWRTHELVVLPLAAGAPAGERAIQPDGTVDEADALGEASSSCAGGHGDGIASTTVGWVTLTLPAGHYELLCNLPNHYADGMYQELVVS